MQLPEFNNGNGTQPGSPDNNQKSIQEQYAEAGKTWGKAIDESLASPLERYSQWEERQPGVQAMLDHFSKIEEEEITLPMLHDYANATPDWYSEQIRSTFGSLQDPDGKKRVDAETKLASILTAITDYRNLVRQTKEDLQDIREKNPGLIGNQIEKPVGIAVDNLKKFASGFWNAPLKEQAIMVAGVAASIMALKAALSFVDGEGKVWKNVKKVAGITVGIGVTGLAFEAMNRTVERAWGRPLISASGSVFTTSQEQFELNKERVALENTYEDLKKVNIPKKFLDEILEGDGQYALGIANIAGLTVEEFQALYESNRGKRTIEEEDELYVQNMNGSDRLTSIQRFVVAEDIAMTLGLLTPEKDFVIPEEKKGMRVFYLAMQYKK